MTDLRWISGETRARCAMCGDRSLKQQVLEYDLGHDDGMISAARCSQCASIVISGDVREEFVTTDVGVDRYVEQFAGIQSILEQLEPFGDLPIERFADVGCNFGFGVDLATRVFRWDAEGFDPSMAAARGSRDLSSRVRHEPLVATTQRRGDPFQLILASEVIEHVPDPRAFLADVLPHLADDGVLVITTPSAEAVRPSRPVSQIQIALSEGLHMFLASKRALEALLLDVGLHHLDVRDDGQQLVAVASRVPLQLLNRGEDPQPTTTVIDYLDELASADEVSAHVRMSAAARHYKQLITRGMLADAERSRTRLDALLREVVGASLNDLDALSGRSPSLSSRPAFASSVLFADGMRALLSNEQAMAAARLAASVDAWDDLERSLDGLVDAETIELGMLAAAHLALALAWTDTSAVSGAVAAAEQRAAGATPRQRTTVDRVLVASFVTLVNRAAFDDAASIQVRIEALLDHLLAGPPVDRHSGLDGVFCAAMLDLQRGDVGRARQGFARLSAEAAADAGDPHADMLFAAAAPHIGTHAASPAPTARGGGIHHDIDVYWADARGIYIAGFAFSPGRAARTVRLRWGSISSDPAPPLPHDGARRMFPADPAAQRCGFRAHLLGPLSSHLVIELETDDGPRRLELALPDHPLPDWPTENDPTLTRRAILQTATESLPAHGPIVALGTRGHNGDETNAWRKQFPGRAVIAVDIHDGPGVDLVGDGHLLSTYFEPGSVAAFVSDEVFEHVEAPWLIALEVQRILQVGGLALVSAPMTWPEHAAPNDFWRASPFGLRSLFGPRLGFTPIASGGTSDVSVVPGPHLRDLHADMPVLYGPSLAYVLARKEREVPPGAAAWPYDAGVDSVHARRYPTTALREGGPPR